ncbi:MAG: tetratricopeptide repeat protein [bacterium]
MNDLNRLEMEEKLDTGFEALDRGLIVRAQNCFNTVLMSDPEAGEAYRGLGEVQRAMGDVAGARRFFKKAIGLERKKLGGDAPGAHDWWADPATRDYLRARESLAMLHWDEGRHDQAVREFREILKRTPGDDMEVRGLIASLYMLSGDYAAAAEEFRICRDETPALKRDPHVLYNEALTLFARGLVREAAGVLHAGFFANIYVPPAVLQQEAPPCDVHVPSESASPPYAADYYLSYGGAWNEIAGSISFLDAAWRHGDVVEGITRYVQVLRGILVEGTARRRRRLRQTADRLAAGEAPARFIEDMLAAHRGGKFTAESDEAIRRAQREEMMNAPVGPLDGGGAYCTPSRFVDLAFGLLYYEGALMLVDLLSYLCDTMGLYSDITVGELMQRLKGDGRFATDVTDAVYLKAVADPSLCLRRKEGFRPERLYCYAVEELEAAAEGRVPPTADESCLLEALARHGLVITLEELRKKARECRIDELCGRLGVNSLKGKPRRDIELKTKIVWLKTPRYELWGASPYELLMEDMQAPPEAPE